MAEDADEAPAVATAAGGSYWSDCVTPSRSGIEESYGVKEEEGKKEIGKTKMEGGGVE